MPGSTALSEGFAEAADVSGFEREQQSKNVGANGNDQKRLIRARTRKPRALGCGRNAYLANLAAGIDTDLTRAWARRENMRWRRIGLLR